MGGTEKFKDYPVKDEFVQVQVTAFNAIWFSVGDNWQWLATAIVIPLAIWLWKRRANFRKRKLAASKHAVIAVPLQRGPPLVEEPSQPEPREKGGGEIGLNRRAPTLFLCETHGFC
jgi:hypothetical protein